MAIGLTPTPWVRHPPGAERTLPSDTWVEARLRGMGYARNCAGNLDNWRWRETGPGTVQSYRVLA